MAVSQTIPEAARKKLKRIGAFLNALTLVAPALGGKAAFRIFCTPRRLKIRENDAAFLASAEPGEFRFRNLRLKTYHWPAARPGAPAILLIHGWESGSARWMRYVRPLNQAGFSVRAFDGPASGNSTGKLLNVLLLSAAVHEYIRLNGAPYGIVGHSLGGAAAVMSLSTLHTPRPQKMVLMGVFAESRRVIHDFAEVLGANDRAVQAIFREIEKRSKMPIDAYSVAAKATELKDLDGLVIHDALDEVAPVSEGRRVAECWGARFLETKGLGHRLQDQSVVRAVINFFRE